MSLVPRLYETINERTTLDHVGGLPLLSLHSVNPRGWQFAAKHAIDRGVATIGLDHHQSTAARAHRRRPALLRGPILFRQRRVGRDGREFDLLKFRTMRVAGLATSSFELPDGVAPGGVEGSDRRTRIGRLLRETSLDELPQLLNVLRGDMSLVGPRPERPEFVARFARDVARYEERHRVKSGITGWAQVHGLRGQTSIADRVEWDNYYIQNWSLQTRSEDPGIDHSGTPPLSRIAFAGDAGSVPGSTRPLWMTAASPHSRSWTQVLRAVARRRAVILGYHGVASQAWREDRFMLQIRPERFRRQLESMSSRDSGS